MNPEPMTLSKLRSTTALLPLVEDVIVIDFETRSAADISETGALKYAQHHTTAILCLAYTLNNAKTKQLLPPPGASVFTKDNVEMPLWVRDRYWEPPRNIKIEAWNAEFEKAIWREICVAQLGWPDIPDECWRDTMIQAAVCALPLALGRCGSVLCLPIQKDEEGGTVMKKLARPRSKRGEQPVVFWERPSPADYDAVDARGKGITKARRAALDKIDQDFQTTYAYNIDDVDAEREIMYAIPRMTPTEIRHWMHTCEINKRGYYIDEMELDNTLRMIREYEAFQDERICELTDGAVKTATNPAGIRVWMRDKHGIHTDSLDKAHVVDLLAKKHLPEKVRKVLEIRQDIGKASTSKLWKWKVSRCRDERVHGSLVHHGTTTGRAAARGAQIQNLPRGTLKEADVLKAFDLIRNGAHWSELKTLGEPLNVISSCLRGFIQAAPDHRLMSADFSNIEGRVVAWISDEETKLQKFRDYDTFVLDENGNKIPNEKGDDFLRVGHDLYRITASGILHKDINDVTKDERQAYGKVPELACLAPETLLLTNLGYCALSDLTMEHLLWDGVEFIGHNGVIFKGIKKVTQIDGVTVTPDHLVLTGDNKWAEVDELLTYPEILKTALDVGAPSIHIENPTSKSLIERTSYKHVSDVYDVVNAGPRNRFTIKTDSGHLIVHNCGFLGGAGAFQMMAKTYGVELEENEVKKIVKGWRDIHPNIVSYGYRNYEKVMDVVRTGKPKVSGKVTWYLEDLFLCCLLPSGRVLRYAYPRIERVTTPWGEEKLGLTYMTMKKPQNAKKEVEISDDDEIGDAKWIRIGASPGILTENITQAIARDIMIEAAYELEYKYGYKIIMSIHDELVAEVPNGFGSLEEFIELMARKVEWAPDLPISCAGWEGPRYKKD